MGSFSITHWLILLVVVALVFGTSKLKNIGNDVGSAVKDFKDAVKDETSHQSEKVKNHVIDHQADHEPSETVEPIKSEDKTNV